MYKTIRSDEINTFETILSMFNGTSQFIINNPWFEFSSYLKQKESIENYLNKVKDYNNISYLTTPYILIRNEENKYTAWFDIKWTGESNKKTYLIANPWNKNSDIKSNDNSNQINIWVKPLRNEISDLTEEDLKLMKFDKQLTCGMDIIIACTILNINPSKFETDNDLLNEISKQLPQFKKKDEYIQLFKHDTENITDEVYIINELKKSKLKNNHVLYKRIFSSSDIIFRNNFRLNEK